MHHTLLSSDTICAVATAPGSGGLAVIRLSGSEAIGITDQLFHCRQLPSLERAKDRTSYFGRFIHEGQLIDEGLVTTFRAPHSYTGEEVVEVSCHGSRYIQQALLEALTDHGCRIAGPGEFTQRAYLNGKMDLSRAEAVADLIASETATQHRMALQQMRGGYSAEFKQLRERLLELTALMELELDFSEEDVAFADRSQLLALADEVTTKIDRLAESFRLGNVLKQGVPVAIAGATNVGKSTLLNALLGEDRAIVSDTHGTTRDTIEEVVNLDGILFRFIDTAGLRTTEDQIESLGIARSYDKISSATLVLLVIDGSRFHEGTYRYELDELITQLERSSATIVPLVNKVDLLPESELDKLREEVTEAVASLAAEPLLIAAQHQRGLSELREHLVELLQLPQYSQGDTIVTNARHHSLLLSARDSLLRVRDGLESGLPTDLITLDLRVAITALGEVTGQEITSDSVLHHIFAHFCIGK